MKKYLVAKSYFSNCYRVYRHSKGSLYSDIRFENDDYDTCMVEAKRLNAKPEKVKVAKPKVEQLRIEL